MAIANQDHNRVPMAVAAGFPGGRHQALDLCRRQVLAGANWLVPTGRPCGFPRYFARVRTQLAKYRILSSVNCWYPWPTLARSEPTRMASASQLRTLNRLRAEALGDLAIGIDASLSGQPDRWSGVVRIRPRGRGGLRSSRADGGPQVLPPARVTVPPWPHASTVIQWRQPSARVSAST